MKKKNKDLNDLLNEAFKNQDFEKINKVISSTVSSAIDITKSGINKIVSEYKKGGKKYIPVRDERLVVQKPSLDTRATFFKVIGILGFFSHSILGFIFLILSLFQRVSFMLLLDWVLPVLVVSALLYRYGNKLSQKSIRYKRYLRELGESTVITVKDLSSAVGEDEDDVVDDLLEFIRKDYFKEARLIENDSIFILDRKTYNVYKENTFNDLKEENKNDEDVINKKEVSNEYYNSLKNIESSLSGTMKIKADTLISLVEEIFDFSNKDPENEMATYKFMDYYLPTTIKLLNSYVNFSKIEVKGDNIKSAMNDIESSMDTIILAFSKFLDNLYENSTIDIQTDLSVLKTVMSQDGLLEDDFKIRK